MPCPRTQQANLPACSPQSPIDAERQAGKLWVPFFKVFWYDSTRGMNPRSMDCEADALTTTPSRFLKLFKLLLPTPTWIQNKTFYNALTIMIENITRALVDKKIYYSVLKIILMLLIPLTIASYSLNYIIMELKDYPTIGLEVIQVLVLCKQKQMENLHLLC